jgi:DNA-binding GntR family transcriptional regulator
MREEAAMVPETSDNDASELIEAISQLQSVLALPIALTPDHLLRLQNAIEVAEQAVRAERWAREGYEFLGV